ncbi:MAG: carboxypeptidase-like regulatory domain-containing protein [Verrucomicrobiota bacterium]
MNQKRSALEVAVRVLLLNLTAVFVFQTKGAEGPPAAGGTNWGEAVGSLTVRLTTEKATWPFGANVILKFSVRNQGPEAVSVARNQLGGELEAEGVWFSWTNVVNGPLEELAPGGEIDNIPINFDTRWGQQNATPFPFGFGSRTARFAPLARGAGGKAIRAVSNPVDFEVLAPVVPDAQNRSEFVDDYNTGGSAGTPEIRGRLVDEETGEAVTNMWLQSGTANAEKPNEVVWSQTYRGPIVTGSLGRFVAQAQNAGQVWRVLAEGYLPQTLPAKATNADGAAAELVVRLKRAGEIRGVVLDYTGRAVAGARVWLTNTAAPGLRGGPPAARFGETSTLTDMAGRFALRRAAGPDLKVVVVSSDGHLTWPVEPPETEGELKITLPQPASLMVRYDIPGDPAETKVELRLRTREMEMPLWQGVNGNVTALAANHRQTLLTNLTPGTYDFLRWKTVRAEDGRSWTNSMDFQTILLGSGWTQEVNAAHLTGYALHGEVSWSDPAQARPGFIMVASTDFPRRSGDLATFGKDGHFQTALLEPGTYTVVAEVFAPETVRATNTSRGGRPPDYLGRATVRVAGDAPPALVKIELLANGATNLAAQLAATGTNAPAPASRAAPRLPRATPGFISGRVVDDETGEAIEDFVVQTSRPDFRNPGEVYWQGYMVGNPRSQGVFRARAPTSNEMVRLLGPGYVPQVLTEDSVTNAPASGLEVRLKRGEALAGVVLDEAGQPVAGARVFLATVQGLNLTDGKFQYGVFRGGSNNTDAAGRFAMRGEGGPAQRVVVVSPDNHLMWPAEQSAAGEEMKIRLPKPGTLIVRYDIPGDEPEAKPELYFWSRDKEMPLWTNLSFSMSLTVSNGGQTALTNLTPGTYHFRRYKRDGDQGAESEQETVEIAAGQTQEVDMVRTNGQRVRGQVAGLDEAKATGGYIFVKSAEATGVPWPPQSRNGQKEMMLPAFDVSQFGADGSFQTAMLKPGDYTVIADVYPPAEERTGGVMAMPYRNNAPDYVGAAKVTVTSEAMGPVSIQITQAPYVDIAGSGVDDETGAPIPDLMIMTGKVNPEKPDEILWNEGYQGAYQGGRFLLWAQKEGTALRFLANGYVAQALTRSEIIASRRTANLQVRLKRGGEIRGVVLDHGGWPVAGAKVYLAPPDLNYVRFGEVMSSGSGAGMITYWAHTFATTDAAGHFSMRGVEEGKPTRVIAVSEDGNMVQPAPASGPGQDLKITLPEPATLIVHYDIAGDEEKAYFNLTLRTNELKPPLWKGVTLQPRGEAANGGQMVLSNLTPGAYDFARTRRGGVNGNGGACVFGDPAVVVQTDLQRVVLQSGRTQEVKMARSAGRRVRGQVAGLEAFTNTAGSFLYAVSATAIHGPQDFTTNKMDACFDAVSLGRDGDFETALLEPGTYTLVAEVYLWGEVSNRETIADDEPQYGGMMYMRPERLALVATAKVTVTPNNAAPPPVRMVLRPLVDAEAAP